jgi:hypothetical protein
MELVQEFERILDALAASGIPIAVCGGLAVAIHGHPRATRDIDLLLLESDLPAALEAVGKSGYILEGGLLKFGQGTDRERHVFRVSRASGPDLMTLDLLLVRDPNDPIWTTRERARWRDRDLVVVSRDGLIEMKRRAGRLQDLADIERLSRGEEKDRP